VASLSQGRTAAAQCGLFTYKSVPVIFEPPCIIFLMYLIRAWCWLIKPKHVANFIVLLMLCTSVLST